MQRSIIGNIINATSNSLAILSPESQERKEIAIIQQADEIERLELRKNKKLVSPEIRQDSLYFNSNSSFHND